MVLVGIVVVGLVKNGGSLNRSRIFRDIHKSPEPTVSLLHNTCNIFENEGLHCSRIQTCLVNSWNRMLTVIDRFYRSQRPRTRRRKKSGGWSMDWPLGRDCTIKSMPRCFSYIIVCTDWTFNFRSFLELMKSFQFVLESLIEISLSFFF